MICGDHRIGHATTATLTDHAINLPMHSKGIRDDTLNRSWSAWVPERIVCITLSRSLGNCRDRAFALL